MKMYGTLVRGACRNNPIGAAKKTAAGTRLKICTPLFIVFVVTSGLWMHFHNLSHAATAKSFATTSESGTVAEDSFIKNYAGALVGSAVKLGYSALPSKVSGVYWQNWSGTPRFNTIPASDNLIYAAFAYGDGSEGGTVVWNPDGGSGETIDQFKTDMHHDQAQGQKVILSIGGSNDLGVHLTNTAQVDQMIASINQIVTDYGFDGIDWDLENDANITAGSIVSVSQQLKQKWGQNFIIAMAPSPSDTLYKTAAKQLGNNLDFFAMQFYGYSATDSQRISGIVSRIKEMVNSYGVPANKLGIGAKNFYTADPSFVSSPGVYLQAYDQLIATYPNLKGVFCWEAIAESNNGWPFANLVGKHVRSLP